MDFHSLSRKELQALCKKNKIPANLTNVAMADSLANLSHVEGIEEIGNPQFVIQTPQTSRGSSRMRPTVDKEEAPNSCSVTCTRTRRGAQTRNILQEESGLETPAVRSRTSSRRGTSVSKKLEEDKSVAPPAYSTRRSARLVPETTIKARTTKPLHISADTVKASPHHLKSDTHTGSSLTAALTSADTFNAEISYELPSPTEEKPNVQSVELAVNVQVMHKASGDEASSEVLDDIEPQKVSNSFSEDRNDLEGEDGTADDKTLASDAVEHLIQLSEEKPKAVVQGISDGEASFEVLVNIQMPKAPPAVDNTVIQDNLASVAEISVELPEYASSSMVSFATLKKPNAITEEESAMASVDLIDIMPQKDLCVENSSNDLGGSLVSESVELPLASATEGKLECASEESAVEIQVIDKASPCKGDSDGEASLEVFADIEFPKAFAVDNYTIEDSDNLKGGAVASPKEDQDDIRLEDAFETVFSASPEVPSNEDEKGEEIVANVVSGDTSRADAGQALISGDDSFDADADQVVSPVHHALSSSRHELSKSKLTPKSTNKKKGTPVSKMVLDVLDEDKEIVRATEEKEKANPISKMAVDDDNKENDVAEGKDNNNNNNNNNRKGEDNTLEALQKASLRQLRKIVKEKIQEKARPALQSLTDNCLAGN